MVKKYYPELDYEFYTYWQANGVSTVDSTPQPIIETNPINLNNNNIFKLLFSDTYTSLDYEYDFVEDDGWNYSPVIRERLLGSYNTTLLYISDSTSSSDDFSIVGETKTLTDLLLNYRLGNSINLGGVTYGSLTKNLSRLIYQYLDLKLNNAYSLIDTTVVSSTATNVLETMYEHYLVNEAYRYLYISGFLLYPEGSGT